MHTPLPIHYLSLLKWIRYHFLTAVIWSFIYFKGKCKYFSRDSLILMTTINPSLHLDTLGVKTGLLIFRVVAEPWNSGKSAKSREIHKNTQNIAKFGRNLI